MKFSRGNLWFGYEDSENKFKIEEKQNYSYPNENSDSGCELNKTHISHFLWSTTAEEAYGDSRTSTAFAPEDRLFAVDGGAIEGSNLTDGTNQAAFYNKFGINVPSDGKKYDVYGIVGSHGKTNAVYQILPIKFVGEGGEVDDNRCSKDG